MDTRFLTENPKHEFLAESLEKSISVEGPYVLDVGYTVDINSAAFSDPSPITAVDDASDSLVHLSSADFEIDISPDCEDNEELKMKNRQLECCVEELRNENEQLTKELQTLKERVSKLKSDSSSNTPLPTLYNQLSASRKEIADLEKRRQELEAENMELVLRLDKKDFVRCEAEADNGKSEVLTSDASPQRRAHTFYGTVNGTASSKATQLPSLEREDFEATKLEFAEKLVQKEEVIQKLQRERDECVNRLNMLDAGIDGLETRFELQLSNYQAEVAQKFEQMLKTVAELHEAEDEIEKNLTAVNSEVHRILMSFPAEIEKLRYEQQSIKGQDEQDMEELQQILQQKTKNLDEAHKQISVLSDEANRKSSIITERENTIEELESKVASMKTQRIAPSGIPPSMPSFKELDAMREQITHLEKTLAEERMANETLLREKDAAEDAYLSITAVEDGPSLEDLKKQNKELKTELMEVSERLVAMEEQNDSLKDEMENQSDFFGQCLNLEEELQAQTRMNKGLEEQLSRRKKRIDVLQNELGNLRQQLGDMEGGFGHRKRMKESKAAVSSHVDDMLRYELRYEELDRVLSGVQAERDELLQDKASLNKMMHSLVKENKTATRSLNKLKSECPALKEEVEEARAYIKKLHARLKVESLARQHSGKSTASSVMEDDIMNKLVSSQVALAEMDARMINLRKELHKSVARTMYLTTKNNRLEKQLRST